MVGMWVDIFSLGILIVSLFMVMVLRWERLMTQIDGGVDPFSNNLVRLLLSLLT